MREEGGRSEGGREEVGDMVAAYTTVVGRVNEWVGGWM